MRDLLSGEMTSVPSGCSAYSRAIALHALAAVADFVHAALSIQPGDGFPHLAAGELLDRLFQRRVFLPHDLIEPRRAHSGLLQLLERSAGIHGLVLPRVAHQHHAVILL